MEISGAVFSSTNTTLLLFVLFLDLLILTSGLGLICGAFFSNSDFTGFGSATSRSKLHEQRRKNREVAEWYFQSHLYSDIISPWNINAGHPFPWLSNHWQKVRDVFQLATVDTNKDACLSGGITMSSNVVKIVKQ